MEAARDGYGLRSLTQAREAERDVSLAITLGSLAQGRAGFASEADVAVLVHRPLDLVCRDRATRDRVMSRRLADGQDVLVLNRLRAVPRRVEAAVHVLADTEQPAPSLMHILDDLRSASGGRFAVPMLWREP